MGSVESLPITCFRSSKPSSVVTFARGMNSSAATLLAGSIWTPDGSPNRSTKGFTIFAIILLQIERTAFDSCIEDRNDLARCSNIWPGVQLPRHSTCFESRIFSASAKICSKLLNRIFLLRFATDCFLFIACSLRSLFFDGMRIGSRVGIVGAMGSLALHDGLREIRSQRERAPLPTLRMARAAGRCW